MIKRISPLSLTLAPHDALTMMDMAGGWRVERRWRMADGGM
jgi:hypothetical protein